MLVDFFLHLKQHRLPVTTTEFLALLDGLKAGVVRYNIDEFYAFSRVCLVKSEANYDKFDVAFGEYFEKLRSGKDETPEKALEDMLNEAAGRIQSHDSFLELDIPQQVMPKSHILRIKDLKTEEEDEQRSPLIGESGNNPLGEGGVQEESERIDSEHEGNRSAIKAWDSREFKGLDDEIELNTRSIKIALRRLRKFAREGTPEELDLDNTITSTARNAGWLDIKMRAERRNKVKVLILFDIGGSMDPYFKLCEELFSAARSEFKQLEWFYFHNIMNDSVWRYLSGRVVEQYPLHHIMNKYGKDHKLIIVGDATMGTTELLEPCVEYDGSVSQEAGIVWMRRLVDHYKQAVWLNPEREHYWHLSRTIVMLKDIMQNRMYPLTLSGLEQAMKVLGK
ncbi:MAG: VWA domain-containing protein [Oxalobacter sp.]|nr:MAG: VWA domain-containing protein [Oxalobacter sp.]